MQKYFDKFLINWYQIWVFPTCFWSTWSDQIIHSSGVCLLDTFDPTLESMLLKSLLTVMKWDFTYG